MVTTCRQAYRPFLRRCVPQQPPFDEVLAEGPPRRRYRHSHKSWLLNFHASAKCDVIENRAKLTCTRRSRLRRETIDRAISSATNTESASERDRPRSSRRRWYGVCLAAPAKANPMSWARLVLPTAIILSSRKQRLGDQSHVLLYRQGMLSPAPSSGSGGRSTSTYPPLRRNSSSASEDAESACATHHYIQIDGRPSTLDEEARSRRRIDARLIGSTVHVWRVEDYRHPSVDSPTSMIVSRLAGRQDSSTSPISHRVSGGRHPARLKLPPVPPLDPPRCCRRRAESSDGAS